MSEPQYIKCPYCTKTFNYNEHHLEDCIQNYKDGTLLWCCTCGEKDKSYTQSQLKKEDKARCNDCIESENTKKFEPFDYLHQNKISDKNNINKQLMDAISAMNLDKVIVLLSMGE